MTVENRLMNTGIPIRTFAEEVRRRAIGNNCSPTWELISKFIDEGVNGLQQFPVAPDRSTGNIEISRLQTEIGGIVLGHRLRFQVDIFRTAQFAYRSFVDQIQSTIGGYNIELTDPYPNLVTIDLGASLVRERELLSRGKIKGTSSINWENQRRGKNIQSVIIGDKTLVKLAENTWLLPTQVQKFYEENDFYTCENKVLPTFKALAIVVYIPPVPVLGPTK